MAGKPKRKAARIPIDKDHPMKKMGTRARHMAIEMCMVTAFLVRGVFKVFSAKDLSTLCEEGEDGFVRELCYLAGDLVEWRRTNDIDYEDMTDGLFLYEEVEVTIPKMLKAYFRKNEFMPITSDFLDMIKTLPTQAKLARSARRMNHGQGSQTTKQEEGTRALVQGAGEAG